MSKSQQLIRFALLLGGFLLVLAPWQLQAAGWTAPLKDGGQVSVDPRTNRATILRDGVETQLWDGVHRLEDGTIITIRSGQAVPNEDILQSRQQRDKPEELHAEQWVGAPIIGYSPCERLVRRVCGTSQECGNKPACEPARQLLAMEQQERAANDSPNYMTHASGQCQQAAQDRAFFATCGQESTHKPLAVPPDQAGGTVAGGGVPSACRMLVEKVCGHRGACAAQNACGMAQQLLEMSQETRAETGVAMPTQGISGEQQCTEALGDEDFFRRCRP